MDRDGEKLCPKCGEWWPADREFFAPASKNSDKLYFCCRACYVSLPSVYRRRHADECVPTRITDNVAPLLTHLFIGGPL